MKKQIIIRFTICLPIAYCLLPIAYCLLLRRSPLLASLLVLQAFGVIGPTSHCFSQNPWQSGGGNMKEISDKMKAGHFYGKVVDSTTGKGIEFASVQLLGSVWDTVTRNMKKQVIAGQLTESNGDFSLKEIPLIGNFILKVSALGYQPYQQTVSFGIKIKREDMMEGDWKKMLSAFKNIDKDLGNIKLQPQSIQLKEVEVISTAPVMELKLDKKIFNVEKNMVSTGGTAEDVLKQVPSVSVDMDGNVTLRNASPQIFVDGKQTTLTLDQIPADAIQSIEIITNPSAKYDASGGQAGILNIVLKKERRIGYNGNIRAGIDQRAKINGGGDLNVREGKINTFINGFFNQRSSITKGNTERENLVTPLTNISQDNHSITDGFFMYTGGGMDWFKDNRNTFTLSGRYVRGKFEPSDTITTTTDTIFQPSAIHSSSYNRISETKRQFHNAGGSFQYKHLFPKEGKELTADVNYNKSVFKWGGDYNTQYYDASKNPIGMPVLQTWNGNGYNEIITAQTDYIHPVNSREKIETGIKGSYRNFWSKTENFLKNNSTGEYILIKNQSSNYKFIDQVYAAYFLYSRQMDKISFQAGGRIESSFYKGQLVDSNKTFKNYFPASFFPSASLTYKVNEKDDLQFSYSRRINRPTFFQLIPYTDYSDSLNLRKGNAGLKPEFTHNAEISFLKTINSANNIIAAVYFSNTTGLITAYQNREYDTVLKKNIIINTYQNANASSVYGGEITGKSVIKKWLEFTLNFNAYYSVIDAKNIQADLTNERFSWFAKGNFTFKLPKNLTVQVSPEYRSRASVPVSRGDNQQGWGGGWQQSPSSTAQGYTKERYSIDAAVKYEFLKNKTASITINVRDIFASDKVETITNSSYFNQSSWRLRDPQLFRLNFSYSFGKFDVSLFKRKNMKMNTEGMEMGM